MKRKKLKSWVKVVLIFVGVISLMGICGDSTAPLLIDLTIRAICMVVLMGCLYTLEEYWCG